MLHGSFALEIQDSKLEECALGLPTAAPTVASNRHWRRYCDSLVVSCGDAADRGMGTIVRARFTVGSQDGRRGWEREHGEPGNLDPCKQLSRPAWSAGSAWGESHPDWRDDS